MNNSINVNRRKEVFVICDDRSWVWDFIKTCNFTGIDYVRLSSSIPLRQSWERFKNCQKIMVYWESRHRTGGAIIEEILEIDPNFDVAHKIIVLTSNPTREEVVYFNELGIYRIITLRNREQDLVQAIGELRAHIDHSSDKNGLDLFWQKQLNVLQNYILNPKNVSEKALAKAKSNLEALAQKSGKDSAKYFDGKACLAFCKEDYKNAEYYWQNALERNANYFRAYNNLIWFYRKQNNFQLALALMQKMHEMNRSNISRMVNLGEVYNDLNDQGKAEHYFKSALDRDAHCGRALNGLAEIKFWNNQLDDSRALLAKSNLAYKTAAKLNLLGIKLVKQENYEGALQHYLKAQYVLPEQNKGAQLFLNIGLCYFRWKKFDIAKDYLKLALIKEPRYKKAQNLLALTELKLVAN